MKDKILVYTVFPDVVKASYATQNLSDPIIQSFMDGTFTEENKEELFLRQGLAKSKNYYFLFTGDFESEEDLFDTIPAKSEAVQPVIVNIPRDYAGNINDIIKGHFERHFENVLSGAKED